MHFLFLDNSFSSQLLNRVKDERSKRERENRRKQQEERKAEKEEKQREVVEWEDSLLHGDMKKQMKAMWEVRQWRQVSFNLI